MINTARSRLRVRSLDLQGGEAWAVWRGHWLDAADAELAIRGYAVKRQHLSDGPKGLVCWCRCRRESTAGAGERSRHRQRQAACGSEPPHTVCGRTGIGCPVPALAPEDRGAGPGEEGKQAASVTEERRRAGCCCPDGWAARYVRRRGVDACCGYVPTKQSRWHDRRYDWHGANGPTTPEEHMPHWRS